MTGKNLRAENLNIEKDFNPINKELFNQLDEEGYSIDFDDWDEPNMGIWSKKKSIIIYFGTGKNTQSGLTHELLHVKMKSFGYISGNYLQLALNSNSNLNLIFDSQLCQHIDNCMDHIKMYPFFIEYGYKPKEFLDNGNKRLSSVRDLKKINLKREKQINYKDVNSYIGNLISILSDHLDNNYSKHLKILKEKDEPLFNIVSKFWGNWKAFDITNIDPIYNSDIELMDNFIDEMEVWIKSKKKEI